MFQKATDLFECEVRFCEKYADALPDISKYIGILDSAIALDPKDSEMKMTKDFWYSLKKDYESQGETYLDIYQTHKEKANSMLFEIAVCKDKLGQGDSADYYYDKFIKETKNRSKR